MLALPHLSSEQQFPAGSVKFLSCLQIPGGLAAQTMVLKMEMPTAHLLLPKAFEVSDPICRTKSHPRRWNISNKDWYLLYDLIYCQDFQSGIILLYLILLIGEILCGGKVISNGN